MAAKASALRLIVTMFVLVVAVAAPIGLASSTLPGIWSGLLVPFCILVASIGLAVMGARKNRAAWSPPARAFFGLGAVLILLLAVGLMSFRRGFTVIGALPFVSFILMPLGVQLAVYGLKKRRTGQSLHCPKCDYERGCPQENAPPRCPECAHDWSGRWVRGAVTPSRPLAAAGLTMCALGLIPLLVQFTGVGAQMVQVLPNAVLIPLTASDAMGRNAGAWSELGRRTLSPADLDRLAARLLDVRRRTGYLYGSGAAWLETAVASGTISTPLIDRYYHEWFEPEADLPDRVRVGEKVPVRLIGTGRHGQPTTWMYIWQDEARVGGVPIGDQRDRDSRQWEFSLYLSADPVTGKHRAYTGMPSIDFPRLDTSGSGRLEVEVRGYRCVCPAGVMPIKALSPDGTVQRPQGAIYFEPFTVKKTVEVGS